MKTLKNFFKTAIISAVVAVVMFLSVSVFSNTAKAENDPNYGPGTYTETVYIDGHWYMIVYSDVNDPYTVIVDPTW